MKVKPFSPERFPPDTCRSATSRRFVVCAPGQVRAGA
nr:MAG TPA: hypothetical protein [Caudoviricetes sp.]